MLPVILPTLVEPFSVPLPEVVVYSIIKQMQLVEPSILVLLLLDIASECCLVDPNRGNIVATRPEVLSREVFLSPTKRPGDMDCTLALDIPDHLRDRIFGWNRD